MSFAPKSKLPRLERQWYRGRTAVLWTHTLHDRATGWLTPDFHHRFREILLHSCARHDLTCPAYVLMPDHWHLLWLGQSETSDQLQATKFLREHLTPVLSPHRLQPQAHDHVLREEERARDAIRSAGHYIFENPVRAELTEDWKTWSYIGAIVAGYPRLDPREEDHWERFWKIHARTTE